MRRSLHTRPAAVRRGAAAAVAALAISGLAACGDSGGSDGADDAGGSKAEEPAAGSLVLADLDEGDEVSPDEFVDTVADGLEESTTAHLTMEVGAGAQGSVEAEGDLDYTTKPPSMAMTMEVMGSSMDLRMVDGIIYMSMGELSQGKFFKIDPSDPDSIYGQMGMSKLLEQSDPIGALETMKDSIDSVTFEGTEEVDGRELDHYELTVDAKGALAANGADLPAEVEKELPETLSYDLWLDDEDRFAQMQMDYEVMQQDISMKMVLDDWGTDVSIEAPPADEVTEMPDLGSLGGATSGA